MTRDAARQRRPPAGWFYPVTITYLCIAVTVIIFLLVTTDPIPK